MSKCIMCGSYEINHSHHGRDGSDPDLCDVCYWRKRAGDEADVEREACAKICDNHARSHETVSRSAKSDDDRELSINMSLGATGCAGTIRERSNVQIEGMAATKLGRSAES